MLETDADKDTQNVPENSLYNSLSAKEKVCISFC